MTGTLAAIEKSDVKMIELATQRTRRKILSWEALELEEADDPLNMSHHWVRKEPLSQQSSKINHDRSVLKLRRAFHQPASIKSKNIGNCKRNTNSTFHFRQEVITRSSETHKGGLNHNYKALNHAIYIERRDAVAESCETIQMYKLDSQVNLQLEYIERQSAVALSGSKRMVFSNISDIQAERHEFWSLIESHDRKPSEDQISFNPNMAPAVFDALCRSNPPPALASSLIHGTREPFTVKLDNGSTAVKWLNAQPGISGSGVVKPKSGRGGRIQNRIITEFPHELPLAAMEQILKTFLHEFDTRSLPYTAAIHAPDHNNDARNWHLHVIYHERPAAKIDGQWDFTIKGAVKHRTKINFPHRQNRLRECNDRAWLPMLRQCWADSVNDQLIKHGIERRYDPRSYKNMGINKKPGVHLGPRNSALEAQGIATKPGVHNAIQEWDAADEAVEQRKVGALMTIKTTCDRWLDTSGVRGDRSTPAPILAKIGEFAIKGNQQIEYQYGIEMLQLLYERAVSRAKKVQLSRISELKVLQTEPVTAGRQRKIILAKDSELQANTYINYVSADFKEDLALAEHWRQARDNLGVNLSSIPATIDAEIAQSRISRGKMEPEDPVKHSAPAVKPQTKLDAIATPSTIHEKTAHAYVHNYLAAVKQKSPEHELRRLASLIVLDEEAFATLPLAIALRVEISARAREHRQWLTQRHAQSGQSQMDRS